jgi:hypothetical protein
MAVCLVQVIDELNDFGGRTSDHDPERDVYLQGGRHGGVSFFLVFEADATTLQHELSSNA